MFYLVADAGSLINYYQNEATLESSGKQRTLSGVEADKNAEMCKNTKNNVTDLRNCL